MRNHNSGIFTFQSNTYFKAEQIIYAEFEKEIEEKSFHKLWTHIKTHLNTVN